MPDSFNKQENARIKRIFNLAMLLDTFFCLRFPLYKKYEGITKHKELEK